MTNNADYSKGYQAGKRKYQKDIEKLKSEMTLLKIKSDEREERVYLKCLEMALNNCDNWTIGKKKVNNAESYCTLAKVFADNSIAQLDKK